MRITFTSCQAPSAEPMVREVVAFLAQQLQIDAELLLDMPWEARAAALDSGAIDVGWICGAPYVQKVDNRMRIELLAAPVPLGDRYAGQPIYFSDVIARVDSRFDTFESLSGARFAFNEPGSHSGFHVVRYTLAQRKLGASFFGSTVYSGGHAFSLAQVLAGDVDAAAIDSTVLEALLQENPAYAKAIKTIAALGPSPRPPWVIRKEVPVPLRAEIRKCLMTLHEHPAGRTILHTGHTERFAGVTDHDYDPIRQMLRLTDRRLASIQPTQPE